MSNVCVSLCVLVWCVYVSRHEELDFEDIWIFTERREIRTGLEEYCNFLSG